MGVRKVEITLPEAWIVIVVMLIVGGIVTGVGVDHYHQPMTESEALQVITNECIIEANESELIVYLQLQPVLDPNFFIALSIVGERYDVYILTDKPPLYHGN